MRSEPIDFIGIDYAVDNRGIEPLRKVLAGDSPEEPRAPERQGSSSG